MVAVRIEEKGCWDAIEVVVLLLLLLLLLAPAKTDRLAEAAAAALIAAVELPKFEYLRMGGNCLPRSLLLTPLALALALARAGIWEYNNHGMETYA